MACILVLWLLVSVVASQPGLAQVQSRPTDPPLVTATNESWYRLGEPLQFAGELYYPAGSVVFFNGNTMVRTGHYNGVPLYADTTVEPFSVVLVPISRGLMQPYERRRRGELAGTTGSRAPSYPVQVVPDTAPLPMAAVSPTALPLPPGAISVYTPDVRTSVPSPPVQQVVGTPGAVGTTGIVPTRPPGRVEIGRRPESNDGIWIAFRGERWLSAGRAVPLAAREFVRIGEYAGLPVYTRQGAPSGVIYLPTREGDRVAPYRQKQGR